MADIDHCLEQRAQRALSWLDEHATPSQQAAYQKTMSAAGGAPCVRAAAGKARSGPAGAARGGEEDALGSTMAHLDRYLEPTAVSAGVAESGHWRSDAVLHRPDRLRSAGYRCGWLVLVGDAACGRPFWLGSTLNGHLHDVIPLAGNGQWARFDLNDAAPPEALSRYAERIRKRTSGVGFAKRAVAAN